MKTLKFNTTINCGGCIAGVAPFLNAEKEIQNWQVDIQNPKKILTVETELLPEKVIEIVTKAGFKATLSDEL